jgi:hypothetical protein
MTINPFVDRGDALDGIAGYVNHCENAGGGGFQGR